MIEKTDGEAAQSGPQHSSATLQEKFCPCQKISQTRASKTSATDILSESCIDGRSSMFGKGDES